MEAEPEIVGGAGGSGNEPRTETRLVELPFADGCG